jgi:hypothetical protein
VTLLEAFRRRRSAARRNRTHWTLVEGPVVGPYAVFFVRGPKSPIGPGTGWLRALDKSVLIFRTYAEAAAMVASRRRHVKSPYMTWGIAPFDPARTEEPST